MQTSLASPTRWSRPWFQFQLDEQPALLRVLDKFKYSVWTGTDCVCFQIRKCTRNSFCNPPVRDWMDDFRRVRELNHPYEKSVLELVRHSNKKSVLICSGWKIHTRFKIVTTFLFLLPYISLSKLTKMNSVDQQIKKSEGESKYFQISPESIELIAETVGYSNIPPSVSKSLAEDTSYRLRELIQVFSYLLWMHFIYSWHFTFISRAAYKFYGTANGLNLSTMMST